MGEIRNDSYDVPLILDREMFTYLAKILKVSHRLRISVLQDVLNIKPANSFRFIVEWADKFGFIIDGDFLDLRPGDKDAFKTYLESHIPKSISSDSAFTQKSAINIRISIPVQCPICNKYVPIGSNVCEECGNTLDESKNDETSVPDESYFCLKCGSRLPANSTQCDNCGYNFLSDSWIALHEDISKREGYCSLCGENLRKNSHVCHHCGFDSILGIQKSVLYVDEDLMDELRKAEEDNDVFKQAVVCNKMGLRFKNSKQYADAVYYYKKALEIVKQMGAEDSFLSDIIKKNLEVIEKIE